MERIIRFGGSKEKTSFLDPVGLRKKIEKLPEGSTRSSAIALVNRLDMLAKEHNDATDSTIEAYIADVERYSTTTDQLVGDFKPLDQTRSKVYRALIEVRKAFIDTLSPEKWDKVFG